MVHVFLLEPGPARESCGGVESGNIRRFLRRNGHDITSKGRDIRENRNSICYITE